MTIKAVCASDKINPPALRILQRDSKIFCSIPLGRLMRCIRHPLISHRRLHMHLRRLHREVFGFLVLLDEVAAGAAPCLQNSHFHQPPTLRIPVKGGWEGGWAHIPSRNPSRSSRSDSARCGCARRVAAADSGCSGDRSRRDPTSRDTAKCIVSPP